MEDITCPECGHEHNIAELEMWEVFEEGRETEIDCAGCDKPLIVTSEAVEWNFDVIVNN